MSKATKTRISTRFISYFAVIYLVMIGLMGLIVDMSARSALVDEVDESLVIAAMLARQSLPDASRYDAWASASFDASGFRLTLIDDKGVVLADSHSDPDVLENHLQRPEVQSALRGEVGRAQRTSGSTGFEQRYVAIPPDAGLIVRTSVATRIINDDLWLVRRSTLIAAVAFGLLGVGLMALLARRLAAPIIELTEQARSVAEGDPDVMPRRSRVEELDQLGLAIATMGGRLGSRVSDAEAAIGTLEMVLEALPQGTILVDGRDEIAYANPAAIGILGSVPESLGSLAPLRFQSAVREARATGSPVEKVVEHGAPMRRLRGLATRLAADERVLLLVVDLTESERVDSVRREFVANASHELKTPVSTIIAASETMRMALERGDSSAAGFASRIESSARQLDRLVTDLLDLSRLEREQPDLAPVRLDLLVQEEVDRIRPEASEGEIELVLIADPVSAHAQHRDLSIAVRNLLDNALRHTSSGGSISVKVWSEGESAMASFTDTGEGIPQRDAERVFERFYRVDSARSRATGGTGLGLAIVKHVIESHGGSVDLESQLGVGSTFTIRIRLAAEGESSRSN